MRRRMFLTSLLGPTLEGLAEAQQSGEQAAIGVVDLSHRFP